MHDMTFITIIFSFTGSDIFLLIIHKCTLVMNWSRVHAAIGIRTLDFSIGNNLSPKGCNRFYLIVFDWLYNVYINRVIWVGVLYYIFLLLREHHFALRYESSFQKFQFVFFTLRTVASNSNQKFRRHSIQLFVLKQTWNPWENVSLENLSLYFLLCPIAIKFVSDCNPKTVLMLSTVWNFVSCLTF